MVSSQFELSVFASRSESVDDIVRVDWNNYFFFAISDYKHFLEV